MKALRMHSSLAIFAGFILLSGCKSSTSGPAPFTPVTKAGAGSSYVYTDVRTDSNNNVISTTTETHTVLQSGISYAGKSNVFTIQTSPTSQPLYFNYEANGDLSLYQQTGIGAQQGWTTYPFGSQSTVHVTSDTTLGSGPSAERLTTDITLSGAGTTTISVAGKSYVAERVHEAATATVTIGGTTSASTLLGQDIWFAPEIGYVIKADSPSQRDASGRSTNGNSSSLTSFILR